MPGGSWTAGYAPPPTARRTPSPPVRADVVRGHDTTGFRSIGQQETHYGLSDRQAVPVRLMHGTVRTANAKRGAVACASAPRLIVINISQRN